MAKLYATYTSPEESCAQYTRYARPQRLSLCYRLQPDSRFLANRVYATPTEANVGVRMRLGGDHCGNEVQRWVLPNKLNKKIGLFQQS